LAGRSIGVTSTHVAYAIGIPDCDLGQERRSGSRSLLDLKVRAVTREAQHASGEVAGDNDQGPR
jgi:hypothetical protein